MRTPTRIYLAGPITSDPYTREWRLEAQRKLRGAILDGAGEMIAVDPVRGKQDISSDGLHSDAPSVLLTIRDEWTIRQCQLVLLNTIGMEKLTRQSIGTWSEFGFAAMGLKIPTIVIATERTVKEHPFVMTYAAHVCETLEDAIHWIKWMRLDTE